MGDESELDKTLARLKSVLVTEVDGWEKRTRADRARAVEHVSRKVSQALDKVEAKAQRRQSRAERRAQRRAERAEREKANASVVGGVFGLAVASVLVGLALLHPQFWWLVFIALGVGSGGARQLVLSGQKRREALGAGAATAVVEAVAPTPVKAHEVDVLCDALLADLKASPEAVRAFVQRPEQTVESLRTTAKALDARRAQLQAENPRGRLVELEQTREQLTARLATTGDEIARARLQQALSSLSGQQAALQQLVGAIERVDGEYTSLLVLLQELKTRVAVAKSTAGSSQLDGLQQSVKRLNAELEAITDSVTKVAAEGLVVPVDEGAVGAAGASAEAERVR